MCKEDPKYLKIDLSRCSRCGVCVLVCSTRALGSSYQNMFPRLENPQDCTQCGQCEEICPTGAISVPFEIVWGSKG